MVSACGGPMVSTVTVPPSFSRREIAVSSAKDHMDSSVYRRTSASWRRFPDRYPLSCRPAPVSYIQLSSFLFPLVLFDFDALKHCVVIARKYRKCREKNINLLMERKEKKPGLDKMPKEKGQEPAPALRISPVGACEKGRFW